MMCGEKIDDDSLVPATWNKTAINCKLAVI